MSPTPATKLKFLEMEKLICEKIEQKKSIDFQSQMHFISTTFANLQQDFMEFYQSDIDKKLDTISQIGWRSMPVATGIIFSHCIDFVLPGLQRATYFTACGAGSSVLGQSPLICFVGLPIASHILKSIP